MPSSTVTLHMDVSPELMADLSALAQLLQGPREVVELVLDRLKPLTEAGCIDPDGLLAHRTVEGRVLLESSDLLRELLEAGRALDVDAGAVEVHGCPRSGS